MSFEITSLDKLKLNEHAEIFSLLINGEKRRKLMDLGFIPETKITKIIESPSKEPSGYLVKGTVIALRNNDTKCILVKIIL